MNEVPFGRAPFLGLACELHFNIPQVTKLELGLSRWSDLGHRGTKGFLQSAPNLGEATILAQDLATLPSTVMVHIPRLEVLNLHLRGMTFLTDSFLTYNSQMASLILRANYLTELLSGFLTSPPQLTTLDMTAYQL